jgi:hypothetical protein
MSMWMHAWHGNYDAMQLNKIKRDRNPDAHILGWSCFTTRQFKCWLAWQTQDMGELHKVKWSGENIISTSHILHMLLISWYAKLSCHDMMRDANKYMNVIFRFFIFFW